MGYLSGPQWNDESIASRIAFARFVGANPGGTKTNVPISNTQYWERYVLPNGDFAQIKRTTDWIDANIGPLVKPVAQTIMAIATAGATGIAKTAAQAAQATQRAYSQPTQPTQPTIQNGNGNGIEPPPSLPSALPGWVIPAAIVGVVVLLLRR